MLSILLMSHILKSAPRRLDFISFFNMKLSASVFWHLLFPTSTSVRYAFQKAIMFDTPLSIWFCRLTACMQYLRCFISVLEMVNRVLKLVTWELEWARSSAVSKPNLTNFSALDKKWCVSSLCHALLFLFISSARDSKSGAQASKSSDRVGRWS